jgi:hypothetical protein
LHATTTPMDLISGGVTERVVEGLMKTLKVEEVC